MKAADRRLIPESPTDQAVLRALLEQQIRRAKRRDDRGMDQGEGLLLAEGLEHIQVIASIEGDFNLEGLIPVRLSMCDQNPDFPFAQVQRSRTVAAWLYFGDSIIARASYEQDGREWKIDFRRDGLLLTAEAGQAFFEHRN